MCISTLYKLIIVSVTAALMGCEAKTTGTVADPQALAELTAKPEMAITGRSPVIASPGAKVELTGVNFRPVMTLALADGRALDLAVESDSKASFTAPADMPFGGLELTAEQDGVTQTITLVFDAGNTDFPLFNGSADEICQGMKFYDVTGALVEGTKSCAAVAASEVAECKSDGEVGCITTDKVRGAVVSGLAVKVLVGSKVAGVDGSAPLAPGECSADGATGCVANTSFPGVDKTKLIAGNIKSSVTIAGIAGTVVPRPEDCSADGEVGCVTISAFKAANMASFNDGDVRDGITVAGVTGILVGAPASCASDGQTSCLATASYTAAATTGLADKVLSGQTVAGVSGNVTLPAIGKVLTGTDFGVGGNGSSGTLTLPAASNVLAGTSNYGDPGASVTPTLADRGTWDLTTSFPGAGYFAGVSNAPTASLRSSAQIAGTAGAIGNCASANSQSCYATGTYYASTMCAIDGATSCVVDDGTNYKAAASGVLVAANIKRGTQIGGVTGNFPSATSPLPRYSDDGATTNTTGVDETDLTNFQTQLKTDGTFQFWDRSGIRRTGSGDSDIVNANVVAGINFENLSITGSASGGTDCTSDGDGSGCLTTSRYKSMDTDASVISAWDIRKGKTAGGIAGELVFYKNMVGAFNRTAGTGAHASQDIYDTVDDYNNNGAFPTTVPTVTDGGATVTGWHQATGANWLRDALSDNGAGGGTASDGICNGTEHCVYKDRITGLLWAQADATTRTWETAITYCDGLNGSTYGGYASGWRLPTQKELMQAYTDGVWSQKDAAKLNLAAAYYWSSSTLSDSTSVAWFVYPHNGNTNVNVKTFSYRVLCVR